MMDEIFGVFFVERLSDYLWEGNHNLILTSTPT